jgi:sulfoxide reductase heme-binding subunit YedZ
MDFELKTMFTSQASSEKRISLRSLVGQLWNNFSWLTILVHVGALLPLALLLIDAARENLTVNPIQAAILRTGKPALVLLVLSLACTPLASVFGFKLALKYRRALGLYAFLYASIHFTIFIWLDYGLDLALLQEEIIDKRYVLAGFASGLTMVPLAITSFKWWQKHLGKNWKRLHRLVYLAGILAVVHYIWLVKSDIRQPLLFGAILGLLLLLRVPAIKHSVTTLRQRLGRKMRY